VPSTDAFYQLKKELLNPDHQDDPIVYGFKKLVLNRISYSGLGTMSHGPQGGHSGRDISARWLPQKLIQELRAIKRLVANVQLHAGTCTCQDFEQVLTAPGRSLVYLDPPYYMKGSQLYPYGFAQDHERLAACLRACEHDWVLSYDDCQPIRDLYDWAHIKVVPVAYSVNGPTRKTELVITPRPVVA
jgi:DNA adenine methylase